MKRLVSDFLQSLHDRLIASVGSIIGSTFSTFRIVQHAEQQSLLEDTARRYESEGKTELADQLRIRAAELSMDDPGTEARTVFRNVLEDHTIPPALPDSRAKCDCPPIAENGDPPSRKKRRGRKQSKPVDDMGISLD